MQSMQRHWRLFRHWLKRRYLRRVEPGRLWVRYSLALGLVLVLLGTSHYAAMHSLDRSARDAALLNESGKLPMMSQRVLHLSHHLVTQPKPNSAEIYATSVDDFEQTHKRLAERARQDPMLEAIYFGGDEFCIVCQGLTTLYAVDALTRRLQRALAETYILSEADVQMSASLGVALSPTGRDLPEDVVLAADQALLDAKKSGRNCIRFAPVGGYSDLNVAQAS